MIYTQIQTQCKFQADPTVTAKRWFRVDKKVVEVNMPGLIKDYNKNMGFVDQIDQSSNCRGLELFNIEIWLHILKYHLK